MSERVKFKRRILLVDKKVQIGFLLYGVATAVIAASYAFLIVFLTQSFSSTLVIGFAFLGFFICLVLVMVLALYMSNRVCGPILNLKNHMSRAVEHRDYSKLRFRKKDHFQDLPQVFNQLLERLDKLDREG